MTEPDRALLDPFAEFGDVDDVDDATVIVDRDSDATIVVDRGREQRSTGRGGDAADGDATVVVVRSDDDEATRVVSRGESAPLLMPAAEQVMKAPTRRDRRRPSRAPVSDDVLRTAEPGIGPGLADHYAAREIAVAEPAPQPVLSAGPPPTREATRTLPSVARRSRRSALVVVAAFAAACAVAVAGLAALVVAAAGAFAG